MLVEMEQEHIDNGTPYSEVSCPIALALEENIDQINDFLSRKDKRGLVAVFPSSVFIGDYELEPSDGVRSWIETFDKNRDQSEIVDLHLTKDTISLIEEVRDHES